MAPPLAKWVFAAAALTGGVLVVWKIVRSRQATNAAANRPVSPGEIRSARLAYLRRQEKDAEAGNGGEERDLETDASGGGERDEAGGPIQAPDGPGQSSAPPSKAAATEAATTVASPSRLVATMRRNSQLALEVGGRPHHFHSRFVCSANAIGDPAFDEESGAPVTNPLRSLDEALSWRPCFDEFSVSWTQRRPRASSSAEQRSRLLVCHDMMGGYLDDRLVQGASVRPETVPFYMRHWHMMDAFIYFSHHFVTLPPPTWTNCAHAHGVRVLGTLITENEDGARRTGRFLSSIESAHRLADQLVAMAQYYRFDGWLVNIENPLDVCDEFMVLMQCFYSLPLIGGEGGGGGGYWYTLPKKKTAYCNFTNFQCCFIFRIFGGQGFCRN